MTRPDKDAVGTESDDRTGVGGIRPEEGGGTESGDRVRGESAEAQRRRRAQIAAYI
jgi:hypothetical protein